MLSLGEKQDAEVCPDTESTLGRMQLVLTATRYMLSMPASLSFDCTCMTRQINDDKIYGCALGMNHGAERTPSL